MDDKQIGELIGSVKAIKENTDKIPNMASMLAVHESKLAQMMPKVDAHESSIQRAYGLAGITGVIGAILSYIIGSRGVH